MAFSNFESVEQVLEKHPLKLRKSQFLPLVEIPLPDWFLENLNFSLNMQAVNESEMFFREYLIAPFIQYIWKRYSKLKVWSNKKFTYDDELFGEPDYLVSYRDEGVVDKLITKPLLAVAEAKKEDFTKGWGQCLAEMIACQKINADDNLVIYGIVSTGLIWEFGKLENDTFTRDLLSYSISNPNQLAGLLDYLFSQCESQLSLEAPHVRS